MRQIHSLVLAVLLLQFDGLAAFAVEPNEGQGQSPSWRPPEDVRIQGTDQLARIAKFLADRDRKQTHDFPALRQYRQAVGDSQGARESVR